ncbi:MAG: hypothetical protein PHZ26_01265 [Candidatus Gracilibacteria bacterium]|nr:hypothetical protein [Candidatus Gracilibacteria bacterium]MDD2908364.1 hypothetical protein [Candidatus Gracilibacteria bacterium]
MNDIIPFDTVLNLEFFQQWKIVFSIILSVFLIIAYLLLKKVRLDYLSNKLEQENIISCKNKYLQLINELKIESNSFFYDVNYLMRSFLENYNLSPGITKMTKNEIISKKLKINELKNLLEIFEKYEFGNYGDVEDEVKIESKYKVLKIIKNI